VSLIPFSLRKLGKGFQAVVQEAKVVCLAFKLTCLILLGESTITAIPVYPVLLWALPLLEEVTP